MRLKTSFDSFLARVHFRSNSRAQEARKHALKSRRLQLESLENRELLSATTWNDATEPVTAVSAVYNPPAVLEGATLEESALSDSIDALLAKAGQDPENLSQDYIFNLSSNPDSTYTIYLDFDGHVNSEGTWWQMSGEFGEITTPAYDLDGDTTTFSNAELKSMYEIWLRVSEDYAPFDVNVTTADPGSDALMKTDEADVDYGVRVCVGGSCYDWYTTEEKGGAGGVAYLSSFAAESDTPAYIFPAQLGLNTKAVAEAAAHEVGHTVGLRHDGNPTDGEYYMGADGWAPIMGAGYYESLTQWSKGEYEGATNTEDDLEIITTTNGFGYRADDHGDTFATATQISVDGAGVSASGIVEQNTDVDVFQFAYVGGELTFTIGGLVEVTNLDALVKLYDAKGDLVETFDPTDSLAVSVDMTSYNAGIYYLSVEGTGKTVVEDEEEKVIYTDYASLGQYEIVVSSVPALEDAPDYVDEASVIQFTEEGTATFVNVWGLDNLDAAAKDAEGVTWYYDVDCYAVEAAAGQKITVSFADVSDADAFWTSTLYDPSGNVIQEFELGDGTNSFEFTTSEAGKYVFTIENGLTVPFSSTLTVNQTASKVLAQPNDFYLKTVSTSQIDLVLNGVEHGSKYDVYYGIDAGYEYDFQYDDYFTWTKKDCSAGTISLTGLYSGYTYCVKIVAKANDGYADSPESVVKQRLVFSEGVETPSLVVTTADDVVDATDGKISLREAIQYAEVYGLALDGTAITFADSLKDSTITLNGEDLNISSSIKIDASNLKSYDADGNLVPGITIDAQQKSRVFYAAGEDLVLSLVGLKLTNGANLSNGEFDGEAGGALYFNGADLNVDYCVFCDNAATATDYNIVRGGAIAIAEGAGATISNSVFRNNSLTSDSSESGGAAIGAEADTVVSAYNVLFDANTSNQKGGAILSYGYLAVENSTFTDNKAATNGGAIYGAGYIANSLFVGNEAEKGGAVYLRGASSVVNSTISANKATSVGAAVYASAKSNVINSIVVGNTGETELTGKFVGKNNVATYTAWQDGSTSNVEYKDGDSLFISAAERNFALTSDSIALNIGDSSLAVGATGQALQSYVAGHNRIVGTSVDAGVYEFQGYDDAYEPNEYFATAYDLGLIDSLTETTSFEAKAGMFSNRDWYKFTIANPGTEDSYVELTYAQADGVNVDLYLYDANGEKIGESIGTTGVETISLAGLAKGEYYVLAYNVENITTNADYTLKVVPPPTPDLAFTTPEGWKDSVMLSSKANQTTSKTAFYDYNDVYVRFACTTTESTNESFVQSIYIDGGEEPVYSYTVEDLQKGDVFTNDKGFNLGTFEIGTHTVTIKLDSANSIHETDKTNNERTITFTVASSVDDKLEPNNTIKTATDLGTLKEKTDVTDSYAGLYAGSYSNMDYYKFTILNDGTTDSYITLNYQHDDEHDVNLYLYNEAGKKIAQSKGKTGEEKISLNGLEAGTYYVMAYNYVSALTEVGYTLSIVPPAVPDLTFATPEGWSDSVIAVSNEGETTGKTQLTETEFVHVRFGYATDETFNGDYKNSIYVDGELVTSYDENGLQKDSVAVNGEGFNVGRLSIGEHTITVKLDSENSIYESNEDNNEKTITITIVPDDIYEPNDTIDAATDLGKVPYAKTVEILSAGANQNRDWYKFTLVNDCTTAASVELAYEHVAENADVNLYLYDAAGNLLASSEGETGAEKIDLSGYAEGTYYVQAYNAVSIENGVDYKLTINPPTNPDLAFTTPEGWSNSVVVSTTSGATTSAKSIHETEYVFVRFASDTTETINKTFYHEILVDGESVAKYEVNGLEKGVVYTNGDGFGIGRLSAGTHTITVKLDSTDAVFESNEDNNEQTITVTILADDIYEPNDSIKAATNIGAESTTLSILSAGVKQNQDWYKFELLNVGTADSYVELNYTHVAKKADVNLYLYDASGKQLVKCKGTSGTEKISLDGYAAGTYYVMAYNYVNNKTNGVDYSLTYAAPAVPDLAFATPEGWSDSMIVASASGETTSKTDLKFCETESVYVRFGYDTTETFKGKFKNTISVDGVVKASYDVDGLQKDSVYTNGEGFNLGRLSIGTHEITVKLDSENSIYESNEANNEQTFTITVVADDIYEPNDKLKQATDLGTVTEATTLSILSAGVKQNQDWYKFTLDYAGTVESYVELNYTHVAQKADVNLYLYDASGKQLVKCKGTSGTEKISLDGYAAGTYYVMAYNYVNNKTNGVDYTLTVVPPSGLPDLSFTQPEGWSDSVIVSTTSGATTSETTVARTQDVYVRFAAKTAQTIEGIFTQAIYVDDVCVKEIDVNGLKWGEVYTNGDGVSIGKLSAGEHTIKVTLNYDGKVEEFNEDNNERTITITVKDDDVYEPNDKLKQATDLGTITTETTLTDLVAGVKQNYDYYKIELPYAGTVESYVELNYTHVAQKADVNLYLYDASGKQLVKCKGTSGTEKISLDGYAAGTYYVMAYNYVNNKTNGVDYTLTVVPPSGLPDLSFTQPEGWSDSVIVSTTSGATTSETTVARTQDVYVRFAAKTAQTIDQTFKQAIYVDGELVKEYDVEGLERGEVYTNGDGFKIESLSAGEHTITVKLDSGNAVEEFNEDNNERTITITVKDDDAYEPNDTRKTATNLGTVAATTTLTDLIAGVKQNQDWYKFTLSETSGAFVELTYSHSAGHDVNLYLYDSTGKQLVKSKGTTGTEKISMDGRKAGTYYVMAYNYNYNKTDSVDYTLKFAVSEKTETSEPVAAAQFRSVFEDASFDPFEEEFDF